MKILLDTSNIQDIERLMKVYPIVGVTTNPSILAKEADDLPDTFNELKRIANDGKMIHVQVTAADTEGMVKQARELHSFFGDTFYVKIPICPQGMRAMRIVKNEGINVTVTAVFTPTQALLAAMEGVDYVAPYVDRLDNITSDGVHVVGDITKVLKTYNLNTQVLAASFKNVQQVLSVAMTGVGSVTLNPDLCEKLLFHPYTDKSLEDFEIDWRHRYGYTEVTDYIKYE